jgi:hypothetical protein
MNLMILQVLMIVACQEYAGACDVMLSVTRVEHHACACMSIPLMHTTQSISKAICKLHSRNRVAYQQNQKVDKSLREHSNGEQHISHCDIYSEAQRAHVRAGTR